MTSVPAIVISQSRLHLPAVRGTIERRLLVNFRCHPIVLQRLLPPPFRPKLVRRLGVAGICLIRLGGMHPAFLPHLGGLGSENAAHRIAVEWDDGHSTREGVFIPRRDTNSRLNQLVGGKLFPGVHHPARFDILESEECFEVAMRSMDDSTFVRVKARVTDALTADSVFESLDEASTFFLGGALGWSVRPGMDSYDGLELWCRQWRIEPLAVEHVESSFFSNSGSFPEGTATFASAFLMRHVAHEWHARGHFRLAHEGTK